MNSNLEQLKALFREAGFVVAEPVFSESQGRRYLAVFQSTRLCIKFSDDGTDLFVWIALRQTEEGKVWHGIRAVARLLLDDHQIDYDPFPLLIHTEGIARFFIREHEHIANLFSSCTSLELALRVNRIEDKERSDALRSLGIDFKPLN